MALPATDSFTRANASPLNSDWAAAGGGTALDLVSNYVQAPSAAWAGSYWSSDSFDNDQSSEVKVLTSNEYGGPTVRVATAAVSWYLAYCNTNTVKLYKWVAGTPTQIGSDSNVIANDDIVRIEAEGTTLRVYKNDTQQGSDQTDATLASGSAGISAYSTASHYDDWEGDNLAAGVSITPTQYYYLNSFLDKLLPIYAVAGFIRQAVKNPIISRRKFLNILNWIRGSQL
jgi:hypothetical protein